MTTPMAATMIWMMSRIHGMPPLALA